MPSHYSIVRYVPDPIADERVNVGVVVFGEGRLLTRFVRRWSRVRGFGGEDIQFLRDFALELGEQQLPIFMDNEGWSAEVLQRVSKVWNNSIQLSEPRASLDSPNKVLLDVARTFLRDTDPGRRRARDKRSVVSLAAQTVTAALSGRYERGEDLVRRDEPILGKLDKHIFDLVVANGRPFFAAEGISFEAADTSALKTMVESVAWAIDDVRKEQRTFPLAVVAIPPRRANEPQFARAQRIFRGLKADFVVESQVQKWAQMMAERVRL